MQLWIKARKGFCLKIACYSTAVIPFLEAFKIDWNWNVCNSYSAKIWLTSQNVRSASLALLYLIEPTYLSLIVVTMQENKWTFHLVFFPISRSRLLNCNDFNTNVKRNVEVKRWEHNKCIRACSIIRHIECQWYLILWMEWTFHATVTLGAI